MDKLRIVNSKSVICFWLLVTALFVFTSQLEAQEKDIYEDPSWRHDSPSNVKVFPQISGIINSTIYSPDNRYVLTGHGDGAVKIWEAETGILLRSFYGHEKTVIRVAWSPDGKYIASGSVDGVIKIRNAAFSADTDVLHNLKHGNAVFSIAFSPDSRFLISASNDKTIRIWEVSSGRTIRTLTGHTEAVISAEYSPDGRRIASGSHDKTIIIWNADTGARLSSFTGHIQRVMSVAWSPDNRRLVSAGADASARIWDVDTGQSQIIGRNLLQGVVYSAKYSPDGKQIVTAGGIYYAFDIKRGIMIWDSATGNEIRRFSDHSNTVFSADWSADGRRIVSSSINDAMMHDAQTGQSINTYTEKSDPIYAAVLSNDGKRLVTGSSGKKVNIWNAQTGVLERSLDHIGHIYSAAISSDGRLTAAGAVGENNQLKIWNADTGIEIHSLNFPPQVNQGNVNFVQGLAFHPNGKLLASASSDKTIRIWDVETGREAMTLSGHLVGVASLVFNSNGKILVSCSQDYMVIVWESAGGTYRILKTFTHASFVQSVAVTSNGRFVAAGSTDNKVTIWDVNSEKNQSWNTGNLARSLAFSPDGRSLIAGVDAFNSIQLWEGNGRGAMQYKGIKKTLFGSINSLRYSSGGKRIIAGVGDGTARIYSAKTFRELAAFAFFTGEDNQITANGRGFSSAAKTTMARVDGEWLCITPDGFYRGSTRGDRYINVLVEGNDLSSMDAYSDVFHKPNIVETRLRGLPDPEKPKFTIQQAAQFRPPVIHFLSPESGTTVSSGNGSVNISVSVTDRNRPIEDIRILVNGVRLGDRELNAVTGTSGITAVTGGLSVRGSQKSVQFTVPVTMIERGNNRIEVMAYNGVSWGYSGYIGSININWQPPRGVEAPLPDLWILAVGVNTYDNAMTEKLPDLESLNFCGNDAREMVIAFKSQEGKRFRTVNTQLITDGEIEPTAENVRNGMKFLERAGQRDVVLLFMAGHGINEDGKFYFLTKDAVMQNGKVNPNYAISDEALKTTLNMPGRRLIFIDACQSGGMDMNQFMYSLRRTNAYMMSSSEGDKPSYESSQYKQGLFSYSIVRGLNGMAKPNNSTDISVLQLSGYVREAVMRLTEGRSFRYQQKPVQYSWGFSDFFIAR